MEWRFLDHTVPFGFAHQGGDEVAPGNTIAAFDHAVSLGYRYIETDVHATSDGVLAVFHDDDLEARTGVAGPIEEMTWAQLQELRVDGTEPIPSFDEVVERFSAVRFNIEPKADSAVDPLVAAIRRHGLLDRVLIGSFDDARVRKMRSALGPRLATSPGPIGLGFRALRALTRPDTNTRYAAVQIPPSYALVAGRFLSIPLASQWHIDRFHRMGLQVHVWTVNDETTMRQLLDRGVDAIMTDKPTVLRSVLQSRGSWPDDDPQPPPNSGAV